MNNRFGLKVVSIFLGIFAWTYVNLVIPPTIRRTISSAIEYRNVPELMRITPASPMVEIEVEGSRRDFIISGTQKVLASVDLYNLRPGRAILPVKVTSASGLNVKTVNPPQIQVDAVALDIDPHRADAGRADLQIRGDFAFRVDAHDGPRCR